MGTKYIRELGYTHIHEATLVADAEAGATYSAQGTIRSQVTYDAVPVTAVLARGPRLRARFILDDHGFNGTPPWCAAVEVLTSHLSIRDAASRWTLVLIDPALLALMLAAVAWAFGADLALLLVAFIGTHYLAVASVLCACLLAKGRYAAAGAALGWAAVARVFPLLFCAGPAVLLLSRAWTTRRLDRDLARFFAAFAAVVAAALAFAWVRLHGAPILLDWGAKISHHVSEGSHWDLGFTTLLDADFTDGVPTPFSPHRMLSEEPEVRALRAAILWGVRAVVIGPLLYLLRFQRPHDAALMGFAVHFSRACATRRRRSSVGSCRGPGSGCVCTRRRRAGRSASAG